MKYKKTQDRPLGGFVFLRLWFLWSLYKQYIFFVLSIAYEKHKYIL